MALDPLVSESNPYIHETGLTREVYSLLAQANLLRIRGCWEESVESCMAALRLAPESSSAQSLLGDIYENQGRYDDAAQWYRMALDVNPNSPADRMKLDLLQRLRLDPQTNDTVLPVLPPVGGLVKFVRNPEVALRLSSAAAVLLLFLVVGLAYASAHRHGSYKAFGPPARLMFSSSRSSSLRTRHRLIRSLLHRMIPQSSHYLTRSDTQPICGHWE